MEVKESITLQNMTYENTEIVGGWVSSSYSFAQSLLSVKLFSLRV